MDHSCLIENWVVEIISTLGQWGKSATFCPDFPTSNHSSPRTCRRSLLYFCCSSGEKNAFWAPRQMSGWIMVSHNFTTIKVREQIITNYGPANCHGLLKNTSIYKLSSGGQIKLFEGQLHPAPTFVDPLSSQVFPGSTCR